MKKSIQIGLRTAFVVALCLAIFIGFQTKAQARSLVDLEGTKFDVSASIKDNLKMYVGKDVLIHLRSGKTMQGYVKSVGDHFVHLEKLSGRDFYDVLIRMEDISAMEAKFRDMK